MLAALIDLVCNTSSGILLLFAEGVRSYISGCMNGGSIRSDTFASVVHIRANPA